MCRQSDSDEECEVSWLGPACGVDDLKVWKILYGPNAELSYTQTGSAPQSPNFPMEKQQDRRSRPDSR